jgi:hypothetical protein
MAPSEQNQSSPAVEVLVHRVSKLPVPAAALEQATRLYAKTKESNRLIGSALSLAEGTGWWMYNKSEPLIKIIEKPLEPIGNFAVKKLDTYEQSYPALKKTPEQWLDDYKHLSETNKLVKTIDVARVMALYGLDKAQSTTKTVIATPGKVVDGVVNKGLDITEYVVDRFVVPTGSQPTVNGDHQVEGDVPKIHRVAKIYGKLSTGVKYHVAHGVVITKEQAEATLKQLQGTVYLLEHAKQLSEWAQNNEGLNKAQEQAVKLWANIKEQAERTKSDPQAVAVDVVKGLAAGSDKGLDGLIALAKPYVPETLLTPLTSTGAFVHHLNETFAKATHLSQIKDELVVHAREKLADIEDLFMRLVDFASTLPAAKWMVNISESNGFLSRQQSKQNGAQHHENHLNNHN